MLSIAQFRPSFFSLRLLYRTLRRAFCKSETIEMNEQQSQQRHGHPNFVNPDSLGRIATALERIAQLMEEDRTMARGVVSAARQIDKNTAALAKEVKKDTPAAE